MDRHWLITESYQAIRQSYLNANKIQNVARPKGMSVKNYYPRQHALLALLDEFINNYTNTEGTRIQSYSEHLTQTAITSTVASYAKRYCTQYNNMIIFLEKTRFSGVQMTDTITNLTATLPAYNLNIEELTSISLYLQTKERKIRVYKITGNNKLNYLVLTNKVDVDITATIMGMVPKLFPNIFKDLNDKQKELLTNICTAVGNKVINEIELALDKAIDELKTQPLPAVPYEQILNITKQQIAARIDTLKGSLDAEQINLGSTLATYNRTLEKIENLEAQIKGLMLIDTQKAKDESLEIIKAYKSIVGYVKIGALSTAYPVLIMRSRLIPSDPDLAHKIFSDARKTDEVYNIYDKAKRLLIYRLLATQEYSLDFCTGFLYKYNTTSLPRITWDYLPDVYKTNAIPNPHLKYHSCFGGNGKHITDALIKQDIGSLLGVTTTCNSDLNIGDVTVLREFCRDLFNIYRDKPIIYTKAKDKYYTPIQMLNIIKEEPDFETL